MPASRTTCWTAAEQVRLAEGFGYRRAPTACCRSSSSCASTSATPTPCGRSCARFRGRRATADQAGASCVSPLFSHQVEGDFRVGPTHIAATRSGLEKVHGDLSEDPAADRPGQPVRQADRPRDVGSRPPRGAATCPTSITRKRRSVSCRSCRSRRDWASCCAICTSWACWRRSSRPSPMPAACCSSTSTTSTRSTSIACARRSRPPRFSTTELRWGRVYRSISQKRTLHLALLIHDLGKGFVEDHSEVGLRIAEETADGCGCRCARPRR